MDILRKNIVVHRMMSHTSPAWQAFEREGKESFRLSHTLHVNVPH